MRRGSRSNEREVAKGLLAGLAGGLVASWTMNRFQAAWSWAADSRKRARTRDGGAPPVSPPPGDEKGAADPADTEDATVKAAQAISRALFRHELTARQKKIAGPAVHYAFGTSIGGLYGAAAELEPRVTRYGGLLFGAAFWLVADEAAVPLLGLAKGPTHYPISIHLYALASHFVFGWTTEAVRRTLRRAHRLSARALSGEPEPAHSLLC